MLQAQNPQKKKKNKQALHNTKAFATMVCETGELESTMMRTHTHSINNGLSNGSFVCENTPLLQLLCPHSSRETSDDRLCVAVICRTTRARVKPTQHHFSISVFFFSVSPVSVLAQSRCTAVNCLHVFLSG